jgi:hypothetical protein
MIAMQMYVLMALQRHLEKGKAKAKKGAKKQASDDEEDIANDDNAVASPETTMFPVTRLSLAFSHHLLHQEQCRNMKILSREVTAAVEVTMDVVVDVDVASTKTISHRT